LEGSLTVCIAPESSTIYTADYRRAAVKYKTVRTYTSQDNNANKEFCRKTDQELATDS